jgi:hypothetical protein
MRNARDGYTIAGLVAAQMSGQEFDCDDPIGGGVESPPHLSHTAAAQ